jgi:hypothetical protein
MNFNVMFSVARISIAMMYITDEQQVKEEHCTTMSELDSWQACFSKLEHFFMSRAKHCAAKQAEIGDSKHRYEHEYMEHPPNYGREIQVLLEEYHIRLEDVEKHFLKQGEKNDEFLF